MFKPITLGSILSILIACVPASVVAQTLSSDLIAIEIKRETYLVSGSNLRSIGTAMKEKGPKGNWALTHWKINWSDDCEVSVVITITMPKLFGSASLNDKDKIVWNRMLVALESHEMQHARLAMYTAEDIKRQDCKNTDDIGAYWAQKNDEFDLQTKHGKLEGVNFVPALPLNTHF